jgi:alkylation response protein AidB-like acyl-CoA dehydrogenase
MNYRAPLQDMLFVLEQLADIGALAKLPDYADNDLEHAAIEAILDEAAKVAERSWSASNRDGDQIGAVWKDGKVTTPPSFHEAFAVMRDGGWMGATMPATVGGLGLPECLGTAVMEMWNSANMALSLNPMLNIGAAYTILSHGTAAQVDTFVPRMLAGEWVGTMNLTEPGAGSDLALVKTVATPEGDHYRIRGQKIFITWGEHDLAGNIVHLVLARTPDAPAGTKGISLFVVPKFLVNDDGSLGARNDVQCVSIEHKMGIHGSPTCVMSYGDKDGAVGTLLGPLHGGLACMFTMMNEARLKVGLQGLSCAEGAYQQALGYARERLQGRDLRTGKSPVAIVNHPDVQRMLMTQRALTEAMRAVSYVEAAQLDIAHHHDDADRRAAAQRRADLMIPVIKGWMTELGQEVASLGMQVHGGMGYIEETGAAQWLRDVRISAIYEGTNGIQAQDLVFRKLARDGGKSLLDLLGEIETTEQQASATQPELATALGNARQGLIASAQNLLTAAGAGELAAVSADAFDFMMQLGYLCGAWQMLRSVLAVAGRDDALAKQKRTVATFYFERILPRTLQHAAVIAGKTPDWHECFIEA